MRRPSFCCEQNGGGEGGTKCQPREENESTLARVRRFLAVSMGARPTSARTSAGTTTHAPRCKHHHTIPPDPLQVPPAHTAPHSLLADMKSAGVGVQGVLGRPLDEVMATQGENSNGHGVPTLVHHLCCFLITHGVDYDTLVSDNWCDEEVRTRLLLERGAAGVAPEEQEAPLGSDSAIATGLLRLFLDELPHALMPSDVAPRLLLMAAESGLGDFDNRGRPNDDATGIDPGVRGGEESPGLGGVGGGIGGLGLCVAVVPKLRRLLHRRLPLHNLCLLRYLTAFIHQLRTSNHNTCPVPIDSLSRVLGRILIGRDQLSESESANRLGQLLILCYNEIFQTKRDRDTDTNIISEQDEDYSDSSPGSGFTNDDDFDDGDTTSTDTDDFRSPPVSPLKVSAHPREKLTSHLTSGEPGGRFAEGHNVGHDFNFQLSSISERSTKEVVGDFDTLKPKMPPLSKEYLSSPADSIESYPDDRFPSILDEDEDPTSQSAEDSSCVSAQDNWETGDDKEIKTRHHKSGGAGHEQSHDDDHCSHEERRLKERFCPQRMYPQTSSRRTRRKTKKRHHSSSSSSTSAQYSPSQDGGMKCQSSEEEEKTPSYLASLTSEDEEPTRYDPTPADDDVPWPTAPRKNDQEPSLVLSELIDANEPVTSHRGNWGMRDHGDDFHRTAHRYSRFEDENPVQSNWYRSDNDDVMVSPRSSQAFIDTTGAPPGPSDHSPPPGQSAVKILMKHINSIKKKIKRYEEEFEAAFGYRPSHSEKMKDKNIKRCMSELSKARKELKQMKDDVAGMMSAPTVFPLSLIRSQESASTVDRAPAPTSNTAETIRQVEDRLREKRGAAGRPCDIKCMNVNEMLEEKTSVQKALLYYESVHGRPVTREERDLARPLYDRYRNIKRSVMRASARAKENLVELAPILEHEAMDFTLASPQHRGSLQDEENENPISLPPSPPTTPPITCDISPTFESPRSTPTPSDDLKAGRALGDLHALPISELKERKKEARDEKKKLRRALREFEEKFERDLGRKVQKEDRGPMEQTYLDYKHAKAKLRLLEALLSKHEPVKV